MRRLNLLPLDRRLGLRREVMLSAATKYLRVVALGLGGLIVVGVIVGGSLWTRSETMSRSTEAELQVEVDNYKRLRLEIAHENASLELVHGLSEDRIKWSSALADLLRVVPPGVIIESMSVDAGVSLIIFSGSAVNRSLLVVFEDRLRVLPWVEEVLAPRENLLSRLKPTYNLQVVVDAAKLDLSQDDV